MEEIEELDLKESHPVTLAEVKYLLETIKHRATLDNRSKACKIYKQTLAYIEKFSRISEKSVADDFRNSLFDLGCSELEISAIGSLFPQSVEEAKMLIPSLNIKDNNTIGIGVSNLPNLKYRSICKSGIDFNILLVGSHGVGKTSFINGFFGYKVVDEMEEARKCTNSINFQITHFTVVENGYSTRVTVTEVDRLGDFENNEECWKPVIKLINDSNQEYLSNEHKSVRRIIRDKRFHVCFYCIEPLVDYIRPADLISMQEISKYCNLIPIVCKSDYLDDAQIQKCFDFLREKFESHNVSIFEESYPSRGDITNFIPPFFVISPIINDNGLSFLREYPWGQLDLLKMHSNDLFRLRDRLIHENIVDLIENTEEFYDRFRAASLSFLINKQTHKNFNMHEYSLELREKFKDEEEKIKELISRISKKKKLHEGKYNTSVAVREEN